MPFLQVKFLQESEGLEIAMLFETSPQTTLKPPWRVPGHQARSGEFEWRSPVQRIATVPSHRAVALACIAALDTTDNTGPYCHLITTSTDSSIAATQGAKKQPS